MKLFNKKNFLLQKGFTLIELLIVIAIMGILAAGILVAVDPVDKINQANDSSVQGDVSGAGRASEAYATVHSGFYPATLAELVTAGELKRAPAAPSGYTAYAVQNFINTPPVAGACSSGTTCTAIVITGQLKSKRYTSASTPFWRYESSTGKSCAVLTAATSCP